MTIEHVKAFLEFEKRPLVDFYLEIANLKKQDKKEIQYIIDGTPLKEICEVEHIERRTADQRRATACQKLLLAWENEIAVLAIAEIILKRKSAALK